VQQQSQPITPVVEIETATPTAEIGVADVLIGSIGLIGALMVGALLTGLITGALFIGYRKWRDRRAKDGPDDRNEMSVLSR